MKGLVAALQRWRRSGALWMVLSALFALLGASRFYAAGLSEWAQVGVGIAIAAIAAVVAFS